MGTFVLGVLIGWLAEWLFYTFWLKSGDNDGDCSSLKAELELKNRQISSLQSQLSSSDSGATNNTAKTSLMSGAKTSKSSTNANKTTAKATTNKSSAKSGKANAKASTNKNSAKKATSTKSTTAKKSKSAKGDNLTKVEGIGPKASGALVDAGINTFEKLATSTVPTIQKVLDESDGRFGMMNPGSWPKQARMAADGKWDELKKWQDEHDGGLE